MGRTPDPVFAQGALLACRSVHKFASEFAATKQPLHCLVNNAGEFVPKDEVTEDGFEITVGTNHFGEYLCP
jgi:NAD(P)-dependent dehydrogenase (short-subunit alcohol dehydrogenase family)